MTTGDAMKRTTILPTLALLTLLGAACTRESTYIEPDDTTTRVIREEGADTGRDLTHDTHTATERAIETTGTALEEAGREMRETTTTTTTTTTTHRP
jgi:hypothetical protein